MQRPSDIRLAFKAVKDGDLEELQRLLKKEILATESKATDISLLHCAAQYGRMDFIKLLLDNGAKINARTRLHRTALHIASSNGHETCVQILILKKASVNSCDVNNMNALHFASQNGYLKIVKLLIAANANPLCRNKAGKFPHELAFEAGHNSIHDELQNYIASRSHSLRTRVRHTSNDRAPESQLTDTSREQSFTNNTRIVRKKRKIPLSKDDNEHLKRTRSNEKSEIKIDTDINSKEGLKKLNNSDSLKQSGVPTKQSGSSRLASNPTAFSKQASDVMKLFENHGIRMLPVDESPIITSAIQSGQKVVLTEAGKLALQSTEKYMLRTLASLSKPSRNSSVETNNDSQKDSKNKINVEMSVTSSVTSVKNIKNSAMDFPELKSLLSGNTNRACSDTTGLDNSVDRSFDGQLSRDSNLNNQNGRNSTEISFALAQDIVNKDSVGVEHCNDNTDLAIQNICDSFQNSTEISFNTDDDDSTSYNTDLGGIEDICNDLRNSAVGISFDSTTRHSSSTFNNDSGIREICDSLQDSNEISFDSELSSCNTTDLRIKDICNSLQVNSNFGAQLSSFCDTSLGGLQRSNEVSFCTQYSSTNLNDLQTSNAVSFDTEFPSTFSTDMEMKDMHSGLENSNEMSFDTQLSSSNNNLTGNRLQAAFDTELSNNDFQIEDICAGLQNSDQVSFRIDEQSVPFNTDLEIVNVNDNPGKDTIGSQSSWITYSGIDNIFGLKNSTIYADRQASSTSSGLNSAFLVTDSINTDGIPGGVSIDLKDSSFQIEDMSEEDNRIDSILDNMEYVDQSPSMVIDDSRTSSMNMQQCQSVEPSSDYSDILVASEDIQPNLTVHPRDLNAFLATEDNVVIKGSSQIMDGILTTVNDRFQLLASDKNGKLNINKPPLVVDLTDDDVEVIYENITNKNKSNGEICVVVPQEVITFNGNDSSVEKNISSTILNGTYGELARCLSVDSTVDPKCVKTINGLGVAHAKRSNISMENMLAVLLTSKTILSDWETPGEITYVVAFYQNTSRNITSDRWTVELEIIYPDGNSDNLRSTNRTIVMLNGKTDFDILHSQNTIFKITEPKNLFVETVPLQDTNAVTRVRNVRGCNISDQISNISICHVNSKVEIEVLPISVDFTDTSSSNESELADENSIRSNDSDGSSIKKWENIDSVETYSISSSLKSSNVRQPESKMTNGGPEIGNLEKQKLCNVSVNQNSENVDQLLAEVCN